MGQNISDFYTVAQQKDFARQFQFRLLQLGPVVLSEDELVYVESASLPGRSINNIQVPFMGLNFNVPGTAQYPDSAGFAVTFRCDSNYDIRTLLENSTFDTFDDSTSTGNYNIGAVASVIDMILMNKQNQPIRDYKMFGAYVMNIGSSQYNIGDAGTIVTVQSTLAYHYWRSSQVGQGY